MQQTEEAKSGGGIEKRCTILLTKKTPVEDPEFLKALKRDKQICALKRKIEINHNPELQLIAEHRK